MNKQLPLLALLAGLLGAPLAAQPGAPGSVHPALLAVEQGTPAFDLEQTHRVRVLVELGASSYFIRNGDPAGFEFSLLQGFEQFLNRQRPAGLPPLRLQYIPLARGELIAALRNGQGELAAGWLPRLDGLNTEIVYSEAYHQDRFCLLGSKGEAARDFDSVGEQGVLLPADSFASHWLAQQNELRAAQDKPAIAAQVADPALSSEMLLSDAQGGQPPLLLSGLLLDLWQARLGGRKVLACSEASVPLVWAVATGQDNLRVQVDAYLAELRGAPLQRQLAQARRSLPAAGVAPSSVERPAGDRMSRFAPAFQAAAESTDIDWLLLAAIAQKETRFTPMTRTNGGPTGLMQVNPATARAMGVRNPHDTEQNVLAAARYLNYLRRNFQREGVAPADQLYFMLAAYNAGEGRLQQLRRQARQQGLDPNRWLGHVEKIAQKRVARMVGYVAAVNRFYLAYQSAERVRAQRTTSREVLAEE